jgi:hypothetical protein
VKFLYKSLMKSIAKFEKEKIPVTLLAQKRNLLKKEG